jgi:hypothetical protein
MWQNVRVSTSRWMVKGLRLGGLLTLGIGFALACSDEEPIGSGSESGVLAGPPGDCPYSQQIRDEYENQGHERAAEAMCHNFSREQDPEKKAKKIAQFCSFEDKHGTDPFAGGPCQQALLAINPSFVLGPGAEGGGFAFGFCGKNGCHLIFENGDAGLRAPPNFDTEGGGYFLGQSLEGPCNLNTTCGTSEASRALLAGGPPADGFVFAQFEEQVHWQTTAGEPFEKPVTYGLCVWLPEDYEPEGEIRVAKDAEPPGDKPGEGQLAPGVVVFDPVPFGLPCRGGPSVPPETPPSDLRVPGLSGSHGKGWTGPALSGGKRTPNGLKLAGGLGGAASSASDWGIVDFVEFTEYSF